jgi:hypothetical protein
LVGPLDLLDRVPVGLLDLLVRVPVAPRERRVQAGQVKLSRPVTRRRATRTLTTPDRRAGEVLNPNQPDIPLVAPVFRRGRRLGRHVPAPSPVNAVVDPVISEELK